MVGGLKPGETVQATPILPGAATPGRRETRAFTFGAHALLRRGGPGGPPRRACGVSDGACSRRYWGPTVSSPHVMDVHLRNFTWPSVKEAFSPPWWRAAASSFDLG